MAYGKDPNVMKQVNGFRQSYRQQRNELDKAKNAPRSGGGRGNAPYFVNQYKPSIDTSDTVRLLPGEYLIPTVQNDQIVGMPAPHWDYVEHYDGRNQKSAICSAGPFWFSKDKAAPCHGCSIYWETSTKTDKGRKSPRMSRRNLVAFSVFDYAPYHKMEQIDNQGQIRRNDKGEPYTTWERCLGVGCDGCRAQKETVQGRTRRWSMGTEHSAVLFAQEKQIEKSCYACGGYETLRVLAYTCPGCDDAIIDMATTHMKLDEIQKFLKEDFKCTCGYQGQTVEVLDCSGCKVKGTTPERANMFDVDLNVQRVPAADGGKGTTLAVSRWSEPRVIPTQFEALVKPEDLSQVYIPTPLEQQAVLFGVSTRQPVTVADMSRPYQSQAAPVGPMTTPYGVLGNK